MKPLTVHGDDAHDWVTVGSVPSDGAPVTVYDVTAEPPSYDGAVQVTRAVPSAVVDGVAVTPVGSPGVIATDHLRDRYSSTARRWLVVRVPWTTTTSGIWPAQYDELAPSWAPTTAEAVPVLVPAETVEPVTPFQAPVYAVGLQVSERMPVAFGVIDPPDEYVPPPVTATIAAA